MKRPSFTIVLATLAVAATVSGCSDGVELNGKIFDALGVSPAAQNAAKREPQLPQRTGLVLPPDQSRLPEPGAQAPSDDVALAALNDPDKRKAAAAAERARLHAAYCAGDITWKERALDRSKSEAAPTSPYGPCSILGKALTQ
ncbi:MAG: hypothetical protein ABL898_08725 [Hyphomicrobiaceae bacterium]|nr:hypothetical protein [Hyphomicrobiaceae bacterium]